MSELYSYKGSFPYPLPTDMSKYNLEDFILAPEKPSLTPGQVLEWVNNEWVVRNANESEIEIKWQEVRDLRKSMLEDSDIVILRSYETGVPVPESVAIYRQALRDITLQENPFNINWPIKPV
jgi:hypothetical protein